MLEADTILGVAQTSQSVGSQWQGCVMKQQSCCVMQGRCFMTGRNCIFLMSRLLLAASSDYMLSTNIDTRQSLGTPERRFLLPKLMRKRSPACQLRAKPLSMSCGETRKSGRPASVRMGTTSVSRLAMWCAGPTLHKTYCPLRATMQF